MLRRLQDAPPLAVAATWCHRSNSACLQLILAIANRDHADGVDFRFMWVWIAVIAVSVFYLGRCLVAIAQAIEFRAQVDSVVQEKIAAKLADFVEIYDRTHLRICPACGERQSEHGGHMYCEEHDPIRKAREMAARRAARDSSNAVES